MDNINKAIKNINKLLDKEDNEEVREVYRKILYELYKKKYGSLEEHRPEDFEKINLSTKKKDAHEAMEKQYYAMLTKKYESPKEEPKEVLEESKQELHPIKKFKIDEETIKEIQ
jgi:hypothetical protein